MGTGWRRALCTSVRRDDHDAKHAPRNGLFSSSTPRALRCRTKPPPEPDPEPEPEQQDPAPAAATAKKRMMPLLQALSAPASPRIRSPSRFAALLKASILPHKARCGVCSHGVNKGGASAVFTAECSHAFHFPCIAAHARSAAALSCPVCAAPWRQAPFLASLRLHCSDAPAAHDDNRSPHKRTIPDDSGRKTPPSSGPKVYDDDEPLLGAPRPDGGFNPIPEADEEASDLFPRPSPRGGLGLAVTVAPDAALLSSGRRHGKYVLALRVKAPGLRSSSASASGRRAAIDLVTVLDVSQGMMGDKLQTLKRGMRLVVASLGPADRLSIVAFSGAAKRLLPLRRMSRQGQRAARQIVDRLVVCAAAASQGQGQEQPQSAGCVGDALRKATKVLEDRRDRNPVATVMLLSDTQQQQDQQHHHHHALRRPQAAPPATRFTHVEIPIDAPAPVTRSEDGAAPPAPVEHAFAKCLGGLVSVVMQEVQLELAFPAGEITAVYWSGPGQQAVALAGGGNGIGGAAVSVRLGEMYAEEERELLLELRAPLAVAQGRQPQSLSMRCSYREPASQETVRGAEQPLLLPPLHRVQDGHGGRRLHDVFVATRAVAEARRLAELGDLATGIHLVSSARRLVLQSPPSQQQQDLVVSLDTELSDMRWRRTQHRRQHFQEEAAVTPTSSSRVGTPRGEAQPLTPTSAWRAAEQLAKVAVMRKSMNRVSDLHGFENARF